MKKTLLCFLFFFTTVFYAQVTNIEHCAGDTNFDLTIRKTELLDNLNPAETSISYHLSLEEANNNTNAIANPSGYISTENSKTIYARIDNLGTITTNYFNLILNSYLISLITTEGISCINPKGTVTIMGSGGKSPYQYAFNGGSYSSANVFTNLEPGMYMINTKDALGCVYSLMVALVAYQPIVADVLTADVTCSGMKNGSITVNTSGGNLPFTYSLKNLSGTPIVSQQSTMTFTNLAAGSYTLEVTDAAGCMVSTLAEIKEPTPLVADVLVENQTITITAIGGSGQYEYSLEGINFQSNPVFKVPNYGNYKITVRDTNGCGVYVIDVTVDPPPPLIDGKDELTLEFKPGQTLADLVVEGDNIKWYSSHNPLDNKAGKLAAETPLPLTTVLVDGTTYYASQTINGIESKERLAVTAKLNGNLSTPDFVLPNFKSYPNPIQHVLSVDNTSNIEKIEIISISGKSILEKKINNTHSEIDLSNVASGFYFLKVISEGQTKTIKIVKK